VDPAEIKPGELGSRRLHIVNLLRQQNGLPESKEETQIWPEHPGW
jgi:hypothetical protein